MSKFEEVGPSKPVTAGIRVDQVNPRARLRRSIQAIAVIIIAVVMLVPVFAIVTTAFKTRSDVVSVPPKIFSFQPTLEGFIFLFTERSQLPKTKLEEYKQREDLSYVQRQMAELGQEITGPSQYAYRLRNSVIIAGLSTIFSVGLGLFAAYAFSRFDIPGKDDLMFFILSTRMLPAVVVTIPLFLMYRQVGLHDTHVGMILLYTVFNLSFAVWLLKGFIDEIPREYEEAAMIDGYSRFQAFYKIVFPQALTGIAATTVFCLIFAWNEYAFALMLSSDTARTAPPSIASMLGRGGIEWAAIAAGTLGFLIPVVIVTFVLRNYLLRGVTFGAVRQ
jgi:multiple sugar transport system permease protein